MSPELAARHIKNAARFVTVQRGSFPSARTGIAMRHFLRRWPYAAFLAVCGVLWIDLASGKNSILRRLFGSSVVMQTVADQPPAELNDGTFAQWRDCIRPKEAELSFAAVNW